MSALETRRYDLMCDSPLKHARYRKAYFPGDRGISRARLRVLAVRAGWTHVRSVSGRKWDSDYCPEHKPEPQPAVAPDIDQAAREVRAADRRGRLADAIGVQ